MWQTFFSHTANLFFLTGEFDILEGNTVIDIRGETVFQGRSSTAVHIRVPAVRSRSNFNGMPRGFCDLHAGYRHFVSLKQVQEDDTLKRFAYKNSDTPHGIPLTHANPRDVPGYTCMGKHVIGRRLIVDVT